MLYIVNGIKNQDSVANKVHNVECGMSLEYIEKSI